jgi:hypothetical protein
MEHRVKELVIKGTKIYAGAGKNRAKIKFGLKKQGKFNTRIEK